MDTPLRRALMGSWQIIKRYYEEILLVDPSFKPELMLELVHTGVTTPIAGYCEQQLQGLLAPLFANDIRGGEIPRGATNGYDVIVVYVQVNDKFGNNPIVSSSFISRYVIVTMWSQICTIVGEMGGNI